MSSKRFKITSLFVRKVVKWLYKRFSEDGVSQKMIKEITLMSEIFASRIFYEFIEWVSISQN